MLQNLVICNPVAPVAGGTPQYNSNHCITGYSLTAPKKSSGGQSSLTGSLSSSSGSSTTGSGSWASGGSSTSAWGSTKAGTDSFTQSGSSSSLMSSNWETSREDYVKNTGIYYAEQWGNTYEVILDSEARGFYKNSQGDALKLPVGQNESALYFTNAQGQKVHMNVDQWGRLSVTNHMNQDEDIIVSRTGHVFYTNSQGETIYTLAADNHSQSQSQNEKSLMMKNILGTKSLEGKLYYMDQEGNIHQLFIDNNGGYTLDSSNNIHKISENGTAFYVNSNDHRVKLLIDNQLQVGVTEQSGVKIVQENEDGEGFYTNMGQKVMLVSQGSSDFTDMQSRSQFQTSQKSGGNTSGFGNLLGTQAESQFMTVSKAYYVLEGTTYDMSITEQGAFYQSTFGSQKCTDQGTAYYVDYQHKKEQIDITQQGVFASINGNKFQIHQNHEGYSFVTNNQGSSMFLGSNKMEGITQVAYEAQQSQTSSQDSQFGSFDSTTSSFGGQSSSVKLQSGHLYIEISGQTLEIKMHMGLMYYLDSSANVAMIKDGEHVFYVNRNNQKEDLTIHDGDLYYHSRGGYEKVGLNSEDQAFYTNSHGVQYDLATIGSSSSSSLSSSFGSASTGSFGMGSMGGSSSSSSGSLFGKLGGSGKPSQPANCPPVAYVSGGTPTRNSKGCITAYTVGLQLLMI